MFGRDLFTPDKAFGNWRANFKAEPQALAREVLYRRGGLSHGLKSSGLVMTCRGRAPSPHPRARVVVGGSAKQTSGRYFWGRCGRKRAFPRWFEYLIPGLSILIPIVYFNRRPRRVGSSVWKGHHAARLPRPQCRALRNLCALHCQRPLRPTRAFAGVRDAENPFPWMSEAMDLKKEKNFFETRVIEIKTGGAQLGVNQANPRCPLWVHPRKHTFQIQHCANCFSTVRRPRLLTFVPLANYPTRRTNGHTDRRRWLSSYRAARLAGGRALEDFLEQLELEKKSRRD